MRKCDAGVEGGGGDEGVMKEVMEVPAPPHDCKSEEEGEEMTEESVAPP